MKSEVAQSCPALCDPMDCSLPGLSVHGIFQARVLEWGAISFSRGSSRPRDQTWVSRIVGRHFTVWATREAPQKILEWVAMPSSRGIFPTQGSNPSLLYCRQILYHLSHPGSPNLHKPLTNWQKSRIGQWQDFCWLYNYSGSQISFYICRLFLQVPHLDQIN